MKKFLSFLLTAALCLTLSLPAFAADSAFIDVPENAWYASAVEYCRQNGLMNGVGGGRFDPDTPTTRAELAVVLHNRAGRPQPDDLAGFTDVAEGSWYEQAVCWAVENGVAEGYGDGSFGPEDALTREQLVTFLWNYSGKPSAEAEPFPDREDISDYALAAVDWARSQSIIFGTDGGAFAPTDPATRAELAVILRRFCERGSLGATCAPSGVAALPDGSLLVTDTNNKVLWKVDPTSSTVYAGGRTVVDLYGSPIGGYNDDVLDASYFKEPWAVAPFLDGWAVSDAANNVVRLVRTQRVETINGATREKLEVTAMGVAFSRPTGLAADDEGNLYVSDTLNGAVRKISPAGQVTTAAKDLTDPTGLCWKDGALYIAETGANRILKLENSKVVTVAGSGEADLLDGAAAEAAFNAPQGVAVDQEGTVYVADTVNSAVRRIKDGVVDTLLERDWSSAETWPVSPVGLLVQNGKLYVCDNFARKLLSIDLSNN